MPKSNGTPEIDVFDVFASAETTTIYLTPDRGIWVRLLNELDFGQQSELDAASLRGITMEEANAAHEQQRLMVFDLGHQRRLKLALFIDDWSLPSRWPSKLDERYQLVKRLKPRWASMIQAEIEKLEEKALAPDLAGDKDADPNGQSGPTLVTALGPQSA